MTSQNSTFKAALTASLMMIGLVGLAGCGSSSSGGGSNSSGAVAVPYTDPCVAGNNCQYQVPNATKGFYAQTVNFPTGVFANNGSSFSTTNLFPELLAQAMGVCNRGYYNGGLADCSSWMQGAHDLVFMIDQANPNKVNIVIRSYPANVGYTYNLPSAKDFFSSMIGLPIPTNPQGVFDPMILQGDIYPVNESAGFEIRAYGPRVSQAYNKMIQIQVASGKIEDDRFNFRLGYNGQIIANGTLVRCQSPTCGL